MDGHPTLWCAKLSEHIGTEALLASPLPVHGALFLALFYRGGVTLRPACGAGWMWTGMSGNGSRERGHNTSKMTCELCLSLAENAVTCFKKYQ
uniref:Uncharacterized protein n=1 Tax=Knipowitschia caucasica TaxID=637954 RepID=A0AAV2JNW7_KNICA